MRGIFGLVLMAAGLSFVAVQAADDELQEGLVASIYDIGEVIEDFPDIPKEKKPTLKKVDKTIDVDSTTENWPGTELSEHLFIRWSGTIKIPKDGKYTFYLESDDGSRLFIDGKQLIDNNGLHGMEEKEGEIELKAGNHEIRVDFFENEGEMGCKLKWAAEGIEKAIVPGSALGHKKGDE